VKPASKKKAARAHPLLHLALPAEILRHAFGQQDSAVLWPPATGSASLQTGRIWHVLTRFERRETRQERGCHQMPVAWWHAAELERQYAKSLAQGLDYQSISTPFAYTATLVTQFVGIFVHTARH
jgi:hypothetical protein